MTPWVTLEKPVKLGRKTLIVLFTTTSYWLVVLRLLINGARLFYNSFKQDVNQSWSIYWRVQKGIFPVREALWPEWERRLTGMDVVGVRLVQSKQEQHVGHGAIHLHIYILPLNNNIPPISMSMSSIAAQRSLMPGSDRNLRSCLSKTEAPPPFTLCL